MSVDYSPRAVLLTGLALLAVLLPVAGFSDGADLFFHTRNAKGGSGEADVVILDAQGKTVRTIEKFGRVRGMRATPAGTVLLWDQRGKGLSELDAAGKTLWTLDLAGVPGWENLRLTGVDPLPGQRVLLTGTAKKGKKEEAPGTTVMTVGRDGKVVRQTVPEARVLTARHYGEEEFLAVEIGGSLGLFGWDGKRRRAVPLPEGAQCLDAQPLPGGNILFVADTTRAGGGKGGLVGEVAPDGSLLWSGVHECPHSIQSLPGGNVLVEGG